MSIPAFAGLPVWSTQSCDALPARGTI